MLQAGAVHEFYRLVPSTREQIKDHAVADLGHASKEQSSLIITLPYSNPQFLVTYTPLLSVLYMQDKPRSGCTRRYRYRARVQAFSRLFSGMMSHSFHFQAASLRPLGGEIEGGETCSPTRLYYDHMIRYVHRRSLTHQQITHASCSHSPMSKFRH